jgi:hypothetical protein
VGVVDDVDDVTDDIDVVAEPVVSDGNSGDNSSGGSVSLTGLLWLSGLWLVLIRIRAKQQ